MKTIKREDLQNSVYLQTPKWLFDLLQSGNITAGAYCLYVLMYERLRLSAENDWIDEEGNVYIIYPREDMQKARNASSPTQIDRDVESLKKLNLIDVKRRVGKPAIIYLKIYGNPIPVRKVKSKNNNTVPHKMCDTQNVGNNTPQNEGNGNPQSEGNNTPQNVGKINKNNINNNNLIRIIESDSQKESVVKKGVVEFIQKLFNQGIRFSAAETTKIMEICEHLKLNPMEHYIKSRYLQGSSDICVTKRMFNRVETWEKMILGNYDDKEPKVYKPKVEEPIKTSKYTGEDREKYGW